MSRLSTVMLVIAAVSLPLGPHGGAHAQEGALAEAARIERTLERIEARVLREDAEVRRLNEALGGALLAGMEAARPGVAADARRLAELRARATDALERGDGDEAGAALAGIPPLEARVGAARTAALRDPRLAAMVEAFNTLLRERMMAADTGAARLLARYAELHDGLTAGEAAP